MGFLGFVTEPQFRLGLSYGLAMLLVGLASGLTWRRLTGRPAPVGGVLFALAALPALADEVALPRGLVVSLLLLGLVGVVGELVSLPVVIRLASAAPAAWLLVRAGGLVEVEWIRLLVGVAVVVGGVLAADFDRRWAERSPGPVLMAVSVCGIYYTVPDTREALVLLGAVIPLVLLAWPFPLARLGGGGAMAATGLLAWVVATGGYGRQSSIIGGLGCLGLLVLEPVTAVARRQGWVRYLPNRPWMTPALATIHLALVFVASRVAGLLDSAPARRGEPRARGGVASAAMIVVAEFVAALLLALALHRRSQGPGRSGRGRGPRGRAGAPV